MNPRAIAGYANDLGVCGVINCPLCMDLRRFHLLHVADGLIKGGFHVIRCEVCACAREVPESEIEPALAAVHLYGRLNTDLIDEFEYRLNLPLLGFHTLRKTDAEGASWRCPSCREVCPANFVECWNCQTSRPGHESDEVILNAPTPDVPRTTEYDGLPGFF